MGRAVDTEGEAEKKCLTKGIFELENTHTESAFEHPEYFSIQLLSTHHLRNLEKTDACSRCLAESNDFIILSSALVQGLCTSCIPQDDFTIEQLYQGCLN